MKKRLCSAILTAFIACSSVQAAEPLRIAVAANLLPVMQQISTEYEKQTGTKVQLAGGSSGAFFEQIQRGAPFDLFYSADAIRPDKLAAAGKGEASRTYACGQLALWQTKGAPDIHNLPLNRVVMANPETAPYGAAALQALDRSGELPIVKPRLAYGQDIGQTFNFIKAGSAQGGFVALSQLKAGQIPETQYIILDATLYDPLVQKRVILAQGDQRPAAERFAAFFDTQKDTLHKAGYSLPSESGCAAE
ncbi:molybdate transport system permease protein/molybdate transport system substrate-binding protein [Pseudomonas duriflava]|uniref:Molybdate transport system permease protein/molybdate transport system substrate-binding protein n=1 Tax=Pseudomonas duriflava TaxID=459528 RepID=A0A562QJ53_9PSED|nr:molybdate ABC transporter substrate-binding protein [Pseudomonas duriflava]TWI56745.1 molybdate transport system permease protein/molybdate transport system substrate-binding protein [Pseudomonas duriflava]